MKKLYSLFVILAALAVFGAYQTVNIGTNPNDGTGDTLRAAFTKVNANFAQVTADFAAATNFPGYGAWITNYQSGVILSNSFLQYKGLGTFSFDGRQLAASGGTIFTGVQIVNQVGLYGVGAWTIEAQANQTDPVLKLDAGPFSVFRRNLITFEGTNANTVAQIDQDGNAFLKGVIATNTVTATNFNLTAPQWVDITMNYSFSATGPSAPSLTAVTNGSIIQELAFDNGDALYAQAQFPHTIATTNSVFPVFYFEPHVHFSLTGATIDATHSNVTWQIEWDIASINGYFSLRGTNSVTTGVTANGFHYMAEIGHITNAVPSGISSIFRCRITRPASAAQDIGNSHIVLLDALDVHVPVGNVTAIGSRADNSQ